VQRIDRHLHADAFAQFRPPAIALVITWIELFWRHCL